MRIAFVCGSVFACIASTTALAQEEGALKGGYGFYSDICRENSKAKNCVMTFGLEGASAKALYDRMKQKPVKDACTEGMVKEDGKGLRCFKVNTEYSCDFGYSFSKSAFVNSDTTC